MLLISKATLVVSNVPGPTSPFVYKGMRSKEIIGMIPGCGDLAFGISAISHYNTLRMTIQSDECYLENPKLMRKFLEDNYEDLIRKIEGSNCNLNIV